MSLVVTAAGAAVAGGLIQQGIYKYTQSLYQTKIDELDSLKNQLNEHLQTLEALKQQLPQIWPDNTGEKTVLLLADKISEVRSASQRVSDLKIVFQRVVDEMEAAKVGSDTLIDTATSIVKSMTGKG